MNIYKYFAKLFELDSSFNKHIIEDIAIPILEDASPPNKILALRGCINCGMAIGEYGIIRSWGYRNKDKFIYIFPQSYYVFGDIKFIPTLKFPIPLINKKGLFFKHNSIKIQVPSPMAFAFAPLSCAIQSNSLLPHHSHLIFSSLFPNLLKEIPND